MCAIKNQLFGSQVKTLFFKNYFKRLSLHLHHTLLLFIIRSNMFLLNLLDYSCDQTGNAENCAIIQCNVGIITGIRWKLVRHLYTATYLKGRVFFKSFSGFFVKSKFYIFNHFFFFLDF